MTEVTGAAKFDLTVLSCVPGRVHYRVPACRNRPWLARGIEAAVAGLHGVRLVQVNPRTARVLVRYRRTQVPLSGIAAAIATATPQTTLPTSTQSQSAVADSFGHHYARLAVGGTVLLGLLLKRLLLGVGTLSGNPLLLGISLAASVLSGYPFLRGAVHSLLGGQGLTTDVLISVATIASLAMRESVTALVVLWLLNLGELLQDITLHRTRRAIQDLLTLGDAEVWLVVEGAELKVPLSTIQPGDTLAVYTGDAIPVDGVVLTGSGAVNQAPVTGESLPVYKNPGDGVYAGTVLELGHLQVRAERVGAETAMGRLIARVEEARELRAPIETVGATFSRRFVPLSFALAGVVLLLTRDIRRAMTMLVIACPCAVGLSTPTAVSAAIGNAARRGVLIKGGVHLEAADRIDTVVFDKTGTLTTGQARVSHVMSVDPTYPAEEVLRIAASGELHSKHPLALAVLRYAREREFTIPEHEECEVLVGRGMRADMGGNRVLVGSDRLLADFAVPVPATLPADLARFRDAGEVALCVAVNERLIGVIGVKDLVRPEAHAAVAALRAHGIRRILVLTGDSESAAVIVAGELGLREFHGDLLPDQKFELIRALQSEGHVVAMVGDGINDAPALALADLSLAMSTAGSDVAVEAADIALAGNDVRGVPDTLDLSRRTLGVIRQNYALSVGVNAVGVVVGALGVLNPALAAVLHNLSTVAVVANSSRLIRQGETTGGDRSP